MSEHSWAQQATGRFFEARESPTQSKCDDNAHKISAKVLPFGKELESLFLATGYMELSGWHKICTFVSRSAGIELGFDRQDWHWRGSHFPVTVIGESSLVVVSPNDWNDLVVVDSSPPCGLYFRHRHRTRSRTNFTSLLGREESMPSGRGFTMAGRRSSGSDEDSEQYLLIEVASKNEKFLFHLPRNEAADTLVLGA
ncbi:conserved hypothetical protein [Histoplasma capsulatum G186AR]|uniref:Uncharacterized protein n=1 Tax=Ajellomyces capsulatus (strain G186AR / H82 / ATCC MYA-2454 / RMSCC 2432) TaxID=447093 RepID=C0NXF8_AJECG|nr:uncharacterized protein HCBG_08150 [Histoplasma capsulatum G186AR]EEH04024.1 conserved hypothetical protein [Histoplasma capsulatum G186AR]